METRETNSIRDKSFEFAVRIVKLYRFLGDSKKELVFTKQMLRSGTSVGANIREAVNAQSKRDFLSKINIALKEADKTLYWIELLFAAGIIDPGQKENIWSDCNELVAILSSIVKTTKQNLGKSED
jgi:four helix bundle protein